MKLMKREKVLTFIFLMLLVTSMTSSEIVLEYWVPFSGGDASFMGEMVRSFNRSDHDFKVRMTKIEWAEYYKKLAKSDTPDIAIAHASKLKGLISTGKLADIDNISNSFDWSSFSKNVVDATILYNQHMAIPLDTHALIMYYNKDILEKYNMLDAKGGIKYQEDKDGFIRLLEELRNKLPNSISPFVSATDNVFPFWIWYSFYSQMEGGGKYIENNRAAFNNDLARKALEVLKEMRDKKLWPRDIPDTKSYNLFKYGRAAITFNGVWATGNFEQNKSLNFSAKPIPMIFDKPATWGDSHTLVILKQSNHKYQEAAIEFADWLTKNSSKWAEAGHIPAKKSVLKTEEYKSLDYRSDYAQVIDYVKFYPNNSRLWSCNDVMVETFVKFMKGELKTVDQTIIEAEKRVNEILKK